MKLPRLSPLFQNTHWPLVLLYAAIFALLGSALFWQLDSLVPGYSTFESAVYHQSLSLKEIFNNPLNAPFLLATKVLSYIIRDNLVVGRLVAAGCGAVVLGSFAVLLRRWHGMWTAVIGTILFGLSAWFLHISRLGTPEVLFFGVFLLTACGFWVHKTNHWLAVICCFLLGAALLYTPGMIWFVALGLIWQWKTISAVLKKRLPIVTVGVAIFLLALVPLAIAIFKHHHLVLDVLGLPQHWPSPLVMLDNLIKVPFHLFVRNESSPTAWLGTAPILDVFSLTMFIVGGYVYSRKIRLLRTPLFIGIFLLTGLLMAIGSSVTFTVIMPFVYLIIAAGVSHLIDLWLEVFPRNPIAKTVGWAAISLVICLACAFQVTHYFIGWPVASATHEAFTIQKP
jgi:hypothetical protein